MKTRLSQTFLETLEPRAKDQLIWDADLNGFYVKLTPAGRFVFMVYYRVKGRQYRRRIGSWPEMSPEAAREAAREALTQAREGAPPPERKRSGRSKEFLFGSFWEAVVFPDIETRFAASTAVAYRRVYRKYLQPVWGDRRLETISQSEIAKFRASLQASSSTATRVISVLRSLFQRAFEQHLISANPFEGWEKDRAEQSGSRSSRKTARKVLVGDPVGEEQEICRREQDGTDGEGVEAAYSEEEWDIESPDAVVMVSGFLSNTETPVFKVGGHPENPTGHTVFQGAERTEGDLPDGSAHLREGNREEGKEPVVNVLGGVGGRGHPGRRLPRRALPERLIPGPERDPAFVERIAEIALRPDSRITSYYEPKGHICEEYRLLGKNLLHTLSSLPDADASLGKVVVLSSSAQGEGKTLTCVNLALTLAQDLYDRVVLVDCDLRHPKIHRYLGVTSPAGVNRLLAAENPEAVLEDCLVRTEGGLHLLMSTSSEWNPAQLLDGESMTRLLTELRKHYSLVIVDSPPVLTATDALSVGAKSDGMLFLLRARRTQREQIQEARQRIARLEIRMLGYVINNIRSFLPQIWRKYYYGNY